MASCSSPSLCTHTRCVTGCRPPSCWEQPRRTCCHGGSGASFPAFYQRDCTTSWTTGCITSTRVWFSSSLRTTLELRLVTADFVHVNYSHSDCCRHSRVARVCVNCGTPTHQRLVSDDILTDEVLFKKGCILLPLCCHTL